MERIPRYRINAQTKANAGIKIVGKRYFIIISFLGILNPKHFSLVSRLKLHIIHPSKKTLAIITVPLIFTISISRIISIILLSIIPHEKPVIAANPMVTHQIKKIVFLFIINFTGLKFIFFSIYNYEN